MFWDLGQNVFSSYSYTFFFGFKSFCERFISTPIGDLIGCIEVAMKIKMGTIP